MKLVILHQNVNADRYDYGKTWKSRRPKFLTAARSLRPDVITLTECQRPAAQSLADSLGMKWVSFQGSSILYNPAKLTLIRRLIQARWLTGTQTHALLLAEFRARSGQLVNIGASHLPPGATRVLLRRKQMAETHSRTAKWRDPIILGIDANWRATFEDYMAARGWDSAREKAITRVRHDYRTSGGKFTKGSPIDYLIGRRVKFASYTLIDGRAWSDHNGLLIEVNV